MAFLANDPNVPWIAQIAEISTDDPVLGGPTGPANNPHQALAHRTAYLKRELERIESEILAMGPVQAHINSATGHSATSLPTPDRIALRDGAGRLRVASPAAPEDAANKDYVDGEIAGVSGADVTKQYVDDAIESVLESVSSFSVPDATISVKGKVQLATNAETATGTDATKVVTPAGYASAITTVIVNAAAI